MELDDKGHDVDLCNDGKSYDGGDDVEGGDRMTALDQVLVGATNMI